MRHMVMELPVIIQNRMIGMIQLQQVLHGPRGLFRGVFYIMHFCRWDIEYRPVLSPRGEEAR